MKGELEYRIDPITYHFERRNAIEALKKTEFDLKPLIQIANFGKKIVTENPDNLPYLGLENIESETGLYIETSEKESFGSAVKFEKGQILFPKLRPYLNKVYCAEFEGLCSTEFHIIDSPIVDNRYLAYFLRSKTVVSQTRYLMSGNTLPRLQTEDIYKLLIPIPSLEIQETIVELFEQAYTAKKAKEAEAKALFESIDGYLLEELGITLPEKKENTLKNRVFLRGINEVNGGRLDAPFYQSKKDLASSKFEMERLNNIVFINPKTTFINLKHDEEIAFVPMESVSEQGFIANYQLRKINESKGYTCFQENDLLWAKITPCMENGKSAIAKKLLNGYGFGSTEFHVFRVNQSSNLSIEFLFVLFHTKYFREIAKMQFGGSSGHQRVPPQFFENLYIPFPPLGIQERIVEEINYRRNQAQVLQAEAKALLAKAKIQVEKMILGV